MSTSPASPKSTPPSPPPRRRSRRGGPPASAARAEVMFHLRELVDANRKEIASLLTAEHGKVLSDALGEVARGLENIEFACGIPHLLKGGYSEQAATGVDVYSIRQPLGVVAGITPFNFPAMVPMWMFANALACGNTFVLKPSEKDPSASLLHGRAAGQGRPARRRASTSCRATRSPSTGILEHPDIAAVSFVGSTPIARYIYETGTGQRQAGAGARRRQEPHARAARRRPRHGRRRRGVGRLRLGRRAVHGDQRRARRRHDRRRAGRQDRRADPVGQGRPGHRARQRDGPADHRRAPRQGARATSRAPTGEGATVVVDGRDGAPADGFFLNPTPARQRHAGHEGCYDDEIFGPGAVGRARATSYDEGARADQRQPVRQRHGDLHPRRRRRPPVPVRRQRRHGRRQRADPGAGQLLQLRRLEGQPVRRHPHVRPGGHQLLHPRQGRHRRAGPTRTPSTVDLGFPQNR